MHLTDRHRPERFAIHDDEPYYHTEQYAGMVAFNKMLLDNGAPLDTAVETIFTALEKSNSTSSTVPNTNACCANRACLRQKKFAPWTFIR